MREESNMLLGVQLDVKVSFCHLKTTREYITSWKFYGFYWLLRDELGVDADFQSA
jgi:hypothetical protein